MSTLKNYLGKSILNISPRQYTRQMEDRLNPILHLVEFHLLGILNSKHSARFTYYFDDLSQDLLVSGLSDIYKCKD